MYLTILMRHFKRTYSASSHMENMFRPIKDKNVAVNFVHKFQNTRKLTIHVMIFHFITLVALFESTYGFTSMQSSVGRSITYPLRYSKDNKDLTLNERLTYDTSNQVLEKELEAELEGCGGLMEETMSTMNGTAFGDAANMEIDWKRDSVIIDPKTKYKDKSMNVISSERKLRQWLKAEKLGAIDVPGISDLPTDVLMERTWDTMEDVMVHLRRKEFEDGKQMRKTVVVLGSGWAAHALMKVADCSKLRLIVVSPTNHFVFTPMLASSAVGTVEYRSMTEAVRSANPMIDNYLEGKAVDVNVEKKTVTVKLNSLLGGIREDDPPTIEVAYDHLICSVGCRVNDMGVPGADKAFRLKTLDDARLLRKSIGECFEYASRPDVAGPEHTEERTRRATFLIVGGGPTGVELGGELLDLAEDITREYKGSYPRLKDDIRVIIAHGGSDLVSQFEPALRKEALKSLEKKGAKVYLNTFVTEVGDGFAKLSTKVLDETTGEEIGREESTLPLGLTVWCAGVAPVSFTETLLQQLPESARNRDGRIRVDKWLRPPMPREDLLGSVMVLGDAAAFPGGNLDALLPQTAQVAGQQGAFAARMLDRGYDITVTPPALPARTENTSSVDVFDDPMMRTWLDLRGLEQAPPFQFLNLGILAYLGGGEG
jgi:NADH dehydrogenase